MPKAQTPPGPGIDATGQSVVDPTANVIALVRAESRRQDDLRKATSQHTRAIVKLHAEHAKDLREAEAKRIDAIRAVDVNARQADSLAAQARADTLARQVADQAEAVRVALAAALEPIQKDIADLRRSQYESQGGTAKAQDTRGGYSVTIAAVAAMVAALSLIAAFVR